MKQFTYNIFENCNETPYCNNVCDETHPFEGGIYMNRLPMDKLFVAHLQIGIHEDSSPVYIFLWFNKSLFIRKNLQVFRIGAKHILEFGGQHVRIKLKVDNENSVCLFGDNFEYTADTQTINPLNLTSQDLLDSLKNIKGMHKIN